MPNYIFNDAAPDDITTMSGTQTPNVDIEFIKQMTVDDDPGTSNYEFLNIPASSTRAGVFVTNASIPNNEQFNDANHTMRVQISSFQMDVTLAVVVHRVTVAGGVATVLESSSVSAPQTTTAGTLAFAITDGPTGAGSCSDRIAVELIFENSIVMGANRDVEIQYGTAADNSAIDNTITENTAFCTTVFFNDTVEGVTLSEPPQLQIQTFSALSEALSIDRPTATPEQIQTVGVEDLFTTIPVPARAQVIEINTENLNISEIAPGIAQMYSDVVESLAINPIPHTASITVVAGIENVTTNTEGATNQFDNIPAQEVINLLEQDAEIQQIFPDLIETLQIVEPSFTVISSQNVTFMDLPESVTVNRPPIQVIFPNTIIVPPESVSIQEPTQTISYTVLALIESLSSTPQGFENENISQVLTEVLNAVEPPSNQTIANIALSENITISELLSLVAQSVDIQPQFATISELPFNVSIEGGITFSDSPDLLSITQPPFTITGDNLVINVSREGVTVFTPQQVLVLPTRAVTSATLLQNPTVTFADIIS